MQRKKSPYSGMPPRAFWRTGVANSSGSICRCRVPDELYRKKWAITRTDAVATAGSCFAQHIGRSLRDAGYNILDTEPAPAGLSADLHARFGFSIYSARYGNIYTTSQLLQLAKEAFGLEEIEP